MSNLAQAIDQALLSVSANADGVKAELRFSPEAFFFQGHFPGGPVLPAVVQVAAAIALASRVLGAPQRLAEVTRAKFTHPTGPGRLLRLDVSVEAEGDRHKVRAILTDDGLPVSELILRIIPEPAVSR